MFPTSKSLLGGGPQGCACRQAGGQAPLGLRQLADVRGEWVLPRLLPGDPGSAAETSRRK
jgi:hypothetical protein